MSHYYEKTSSNHNTILDMSSNRLYLLVPARDGLCMLTPLTLLIPDVLLATLVCDPPSLRMLVPLACLLALVVALVLRSLTSRRWCHVIAALTTVRLMITAVIIPTIAPVLRLLSAVL